MADAYVRGLPGAARSHARLKAACFVSAGIAKVGASASQVAFTEVSLTEATRLEMGHPTARVLNVSTADACCGDQAGSPARGEGSEVQLAPASDASARGKTV